MRGYGQFCPVAKAAEIFAERWTPLILRELLCGSRYFSDLQRGVPLISRALLAQRLRELETAGVITVKPKSSGQGHEYVLTDAGKVVKADLGAFTRAWLGYIDYRKEMRAGRIAIDGPAKLAQSFWHWMGVVDRAKGVWLLYPEGADTSVRAAARAGR